MNHRDTEITETHRDERRARLRRAKKHALCISVPLCLCGEVFICQLHGQWVTA